MRRLRCGRSSKRTRGRNAESESGDDLELRAVGEAGEAVGRGIDERWRPGDEIGHQAAGAGTDAEAVTRKSTGDKEARQLLDRRDDGYGIGCHVEIAGPALF